MMYELAHYAPLEHLGNVNEDAEEVIRRLKLRQSDTRRTRALRAVKLLLKGDEMTDDEQNDRVFLDLMDDIEWMALEIAGRYTRTVPADEQHAVVEQMTTRIYEAMQKKLKF